MWDSGTPAQSWRCAHGPGSSPPVASTLELSVILGFRSQGLVQLHGISKFFRNSWQILSV